MSWSHSHSRIPQSCQKKKFHQAKYFLLLISNWSKECTDAVRIWISSIIINFAIEVILGLIFYDFHTWLDEKCENKLREDICKSYQRKGYCKKKKWMDWMAKSCKKTCQFCYSVCQDMRGFQCKTKAITKDCNDKEMMKNCPKACGLCWLNMFINTYWRLSSARSLQQLVQ